MQTLQRTEFDVLVLDVDAHVGVDLLQRLQEPRPEIDIVAAADSNEIPRRIFRPLVDDVPATQAGRVLVQRDSGEPLVEDTVDLAVLIDTGVLGCGVEHQRAQPFDRGDGVDALPEQVRGVHLGADVGGPCLFDEALEH